MKFRLALSSFVLLLASVIASLALCQAVAANGPKAWAEAKKPAKPNPCTTPKAGNAYIRKAQWFGWHKQHARAAKKGSLDVVFVGDSITYLWGTNGKSVWKKYYAGRKAVQFGIPADRTEQVLWRVQRVGLENSGAKVIVLLIGTNNLGTKPVCNGKQIGEGIVAVVKVLRKKCPTAQIIITGIFPRGKPAGPKANQWVNQQVADANAAAAKLADGKLTHFVDIGPQLRNADGKVNRKIVFDGVHVGPAGYQKWAEAIEPLIAKALGDTLRSAPASQPAEAATQ